MDTLATSDRNIASELQHHTHRHLICWKSTFAGFVLAILTFAGVISLSLAFGGIGLSDGSTLKNAGMFAGLSILVASVVSVFVGSYFSVRLARFKVDVVGSSQGLVVGALVVIAVLWQMMAAVGVIGKVAAEATGTAIFAASAGVVAATQNTAVQEIIEDGLAGAQLKSEPSVVFRGIAARLMRGDQESAKNYLTVQSGLTPAEADAKIAAMRAKADEMAVRARDTSATALKTSGWSLFLMICLSAMSAAVGGLLGAQVNSRQTMEQAVAMTPARRPQAIVKKRTVPVQ